MNLAVQRLRANMDDPDWERTTPVERLEARIQVAIGAVHELAELRREGRRVYVRMERPEYMSDDELLRRSLARQDKLQRTVWELDGRASELERERDDARESASVVRQADEEIEEAYEKERAAHQETKEGLIVARVIAFVLFALPIASVLLWWFVLR